MNYDLDLRYRRALKPDGLATVATATQAVVNASSKLARLCNIENANRIATWVSGPRSATSAGLEATVASHPWRSTTRWIVSSTWLRQIGPG